MPLLVTRFFTSLFALLLAIAIVSGPALAVAAPPAQELAEPAIGARAAIVVEYPSGRVLYAKTAHDRLAPASTTKILTAILTLEYGKLDDVVTIAPEDLVGESTMGLTAGEQQTLHNLLYGLLLPSGNDAAMAIARYLGSKASPVTSQTEPVARFADMMNTHAAQMGLQDTHFLTPHGLDAEGHYSSAYDLASLSWYALHFPVFNEIVKQVSYDAPGHPLLNTNEMLTRYMGADGIKTGWTDAGGLCLVTSAMRGGHRLISVVLNAPRWYADTTLLLDYGFAKLAAAPEDQAAEVLSIAKRGTGSWLLASASPTVPERPATLSRGGGTGATLPDQKAAAPAAIQVRPATGSGGPQGQGTLLVRTSDQQSGVVWVVAAFALVGGACCLLAARLWRPARRRTVGEQALAIMTTASKSRLVAIPKAGSGARTLGEPPALHRREPNLLVSMEDERDLHLERAVSLAWEGRQGSSMSEFLLALRCGQQLDVEDLSNNFDMVPAAYLALSRAQLALGRRTEAQQTLRYAASELPHDRIVHLALSQLVQSARVSS